MTSTLIRAAERPTWAVLASAESSAGTTCWAADASPVLASLPLMCLGW